MLRAYQCFLGKPGPLLNSGRCIGGPRFLCIYHADISCTMLGFIGGLTEHILNRFTVDPCILRFYGVIFPLCFRNAVLPGFSFTTHSGCTTALLARSCCSVRRHLTWPLCAALTVFSSAHWTTNLGCVRPALLGRTGLLIHSGRSHQLTTSTADVTCHYYRHRRRLDRAHIKSFHGFPCVLRLCDVVFPLRR